MIVIHETANCEAKNFLYLAFQRSCCSNLVAFSKSSDEMLGDKGIHVFVDPSDLEAEELQKIRRKGRTKILLFGTPTKALIEEWRLSISHNIDWKSLSYCPPAEPNNSAQSRGNIVYQNESIEGGWKRYFCRFDYADEWNNLGYGKIDTSNVWGIAAALTCPEENELAAVFDKKQKLFSFMARFDYTDASILWVNRPVGVIDGPDWKVVEDFICDYRAEDLPCEAVLSEIPYGYDAAVTMRLDCDEAIASSASLLDLYCSKNKPLSLAIKTSLLLEEQNHDIIYKLRKAGGGMLSHSHTHPARWGLNFEMALEEARISKDFISNLSGGEARHVVAPFHHAPEYALNALSKAGYTACIGGIMNHDPHFNLARSGKVIPGMDFIGHSQQCMFHGHTIAKFGDPLDIFKTAFRISKASASWFGYLDHPFSARYAYDWESEEIRVKMHGDFLDWIDLQGAVLFTNENVCLDFLYARSLAVFDKGYVKLIEKLPLDLRLAYRLRGQLHVA